MVEKRRRKKTRIQADSDSDSSDSDNVNMKSSLPDHDSEPSELSDSDVEMSRADAGPQAEEQSEDEQEPENARQLLHKNPPTGQDFYQDFLTMVTQQFGDDLEQLRKNNFGPGALDQLIAGLKQGINVFSEDQRQALFKKN